MAILHRVRQRQLAALLLVSLLVPNPTMALQEKRTEGATEPAAQRTLELSLQQVVELTLRHNLRVRIDSLDPAIAGEQIRFARGRFDPVFTFNLPRAFNRQSSPQASVLGGAEVLTQEQITGGFSFAKTTTFGLSWQLSGTASRFVTNNTFSTFNPRYDTQLALDVRQPLLRDRGVTANERQLWVARNDYSVSREVFRQRLQASVFEVIRAYWGLVNADRSLEIARQSLALAEEQLHRNNTMVRIGVLAAVDVIQTEQQVADAKLTVIQAEITLRNQQDQLKALLNLDAFVPEGWKVRIVPTDEPTPIAEPIDVDAAVREALEKSPEIRQDRIQVQSRKLDLRAVHNQLLPRLDFVGNIRLNGLGGDQIFRSGGIFGGSGVQEVEPGGIGDSFQQLLSGDFRNWTVGLQLSFPVHNDQARAQFAQASIRERQAQTQVQDRALQIRLAVQSAARNVEGGVQQVAAAQNALELAERQYAAELKRFETGTSNTFTVLSFQRQLTLARQRQLNAIIGLNLARANFELARGTLLEEFGVRIEDAGTGGPSLPAAPAGDQQSR